MANNIYLHYTVVCKEYEYFATWSRALASGSLWPIVANYALAVGEPPQEVPSRTSGSLTSTTHKA